MVELTNKKQNIVEISKEIIKLSKDSNFSRIFDDPRACSLNLWVLQISESNKNYNKILYGLIIPSTMPSISEDLEKWFPGREEKFKNLKSERDSYKYRIHKLTYYSCGSKILEIITELCKGYSLGESCVHLGLEIPTKPFNEIRLSNSLKEIEEYFIVRPTIFLETEGSIEIFIDSRKPLKSPLNNSSAFSASLFLLNKMTLFVNNKNQVLDNVNELLKKCLLYLKDDTGLDFDLSDSPRIGNIEFLSFPATDDYELPLILFKTVKEDDTNTLKMPKKHVNKVEVKIMDDGSLLNNYILLRCRLRNNEEIIFDNCKEIVIDRKEISTNFEAKEAISQILITAWKRESEEDQWEIFYEHSKTVLREISTRSGIIGLHGPIKSQFLERIGKSKKPKMENRVKKAESFKRVDYFRSKISSYESDPWVPTSQEMCTLTKNLFPKDSKGHFFQKGWYEDEHGKLSFMEWFNSITNDFKANKIIIVDPYFDYFGVELISRLESTNIEYTVITMLINGDSDQRINSLKNSLKQLKLILASLNFKLLALKSKKKLFHDRYILIFDENKTIKGYHLSNSIQKATENYPLLITPIPEDTIVKVEEYVDELLKENKKSKFEIIDLYPLSTETQSRIGIGFLHKINVINSVPYSNLFFSILLQKNIIYLYNPLLKFYLSKIGLIDEKSFILSKQVCSNLDDLVKNITIIKYLKFEKFWLAFGEWLARTPPETEDYVLEILKKRKNKDLAIKLSKFILNISKNEYVKELFKDQENIANQTIFYLVAEVNFIKSLENSENIFQTNLKVRGPTLWSIQYATLTLAHLNLELLFKTVDDLLIKLKKLNNESSQFNVQSIVLKNIMSEMIYILNKKELLPIFLKNELPIFRALGSQSIIESFGILKEEELRKRFNILRKLDKIENILVLAKWIWNLRQSRTKSPNHFIPLLNDEIMDLWTSSISYDDLISINTGLNGPGEVLWSAHTTNSLFIPLIDQGKLSINDIAKLWLNILLKKLEDAKKEGSSITFIDSDVQFTETCGWSIAFMDKNDDYLKKFENLKNYYERIAFIKTFSRSIDFSSWINAVKCLLWIQCLFYCARLYKEDVKFKELACGSKELWTYVYRSEFNEILEPLLSFINEKRVEVKMKFSN